MDKKLLFVAVPAILLLGVAYVLLHGDGGNGSSEQVPGFTSTENTDTAAIYKTKKEAYYYDKKKKSQYDDFESADVFGDDFFDEAEQEKQNKDSLLHFMDEEPEVVEKKEEPQKTVIYKYVNKPKTETKATPNPQKEEPKIRRQNGFYSSDNEGVRAIDHANAINVVVHNDHKEIKSGSTVRLRTTEDAVIFGITVKRNTYLSGIAQFQDERVTITIKSINLNGTIKKVDLFAYDSDGIEGVYVPGGISTEVKQDAYTEGVNEIFRQVNIPVVGPLAGSSSGKMVNERTVFIPSGYKLLFKSK